MAAAVIVGGVSAGAAGAATPSPLAITAATTALPGQVAITVSCDLPTGQSCATAPVIGLPVEALSANADPTTWSYGVQSTTPGLVLSDSASVASGIALAPGVFVGGTTATVDVTVSGAPVGWTLQPTLSDGSGTVVSAPTAVSIPGPGDASDSATTDGTRLRGSGGTQTALVSISPATQSAPTGVAQSYNIAVSCQGAGGSDCGPQTTITIPLDTTTTPPMTDPGWTYTASSGTAGLITSGPTVVGSNLVITLDDTTFISGYSGTVRLLVTPPNNVTPNNTSWSMTPTLSGDNIATVTVPTPANSTATAKPLPSVTKVTADGGSVYQAGGTITYTIKATCSTASAGGLYVSSGSLVDTLPPGVVYQSSSPSGVFDSASGTITWPYASGTDAPVGCAAGATGTNTYQVTVVAPSPAPPSTSQPLTNQATFSAVGPDAVNGTVGGTATASVPVAIVDAPPTSPGTGYSTIAKTSLAPLVQPGVVGNQYIGTYVGNWVPTSASPSYQAGQAAGSFQTTVTNTMTGTYENDVVDPLPCLSNVSGNQYSSGSASVLSPCSDPAFHTQVISVYSPGFNSPTNGLGAAVASGWRPLAILANGSTVTLQPTGSVGLGANSAYFSIPAGDVATVATIELPPDASLENVTEQLTVFGYADSSLGGVNSSLNKLVNTSTTTPVLQGIRETPISATASIFTVPNIVQLGISKSFGSLGSGPGGTTVLTIKGAVNIPQVPLGNDVVLTDLLPLGLTWSNPSASGTFTLTQGANSSSVTAPVQNLTNYQGSGRQLIRITIPKASFTTSGAWVITPPNNFLLMATPSTLGVYANTDQIFLFGSAPSVINTACTTPTQTGGGTSSATYQTQNPYDLAGDGNLVENFCQNAANLNVLGQGAAFSLTKTVQGDQDTLAKGALGIGDASPQGSGTYVLNWTNVGSDTLNNATIYDILPYVGDTGVSQGQEATPRGSQFAPILSSVGAIGSGISVEYSFSTNPCRNEVYPNTLNTTCVNDWTSVAPADLSTVKALKFVSTNTYTSGQSFAVSLTVTLPAGAVNQVAWNSAATNAADVTDPSTVPLPAEPPKVGLTASITPTMTSQSSAQATNPNQQVTDLVTIANTGDNSGSLDWSLVGPVAPTNGSCSGVSWTGAAVVDHGTIATDGDGTFTTGPVTLVDPGCYSWVDTLTPTTPGAFPGPVDLAAGSAHEVVLVTLYAPTIVTHQTSTENGDGSVDIHDNVTISGSGIGLTPGSPSQGTLTWTLFGPVPSSGGSCTVSFTGATVVATGTLTVTGDGTYQTPISTISKPGCYTFDEQLAATADSAASSTLPDVSVETIDLPFTPTPTMPTPPQLAMTGFDLVGFIEFGALLLFAGGLMTLLERYRRRLT